MLIVKEKFGNKETYSLKMVECVDEYEANTALSEAMTLLKLQNANICPYKEFFIMWDNKTSSVFLCLVMKYLGNEDLASLMRAKRLNKERIEKKAVDALVHIHKMNIVHRNLKPSNIMLQDEDNFVITDFSVETLMNDEMKLKMRINEECKSWMAPEALKFSFSEKSDIWSLGCILLDMMCCPSQSDTEVAKHLCDLRHERGVLKEAMRALPCLDRDSPSMFQILEQMLQIDPDERPTAICILTLRGVPQPACFSRVQNTNIVFVPEHLNLRELVEIAYVKECLALCGSPLSGRKKALPPEMEDELLDSDIETTIDLMLMYEEFEDAQILALQHLLGFMKENNALCLRTDVVQAVAGTMTMNIGSLEVQLEGLRVLQDLTAQALKCDVEEDVVTNEALLTALLEAIRTFPNSEELAGLACSLLMMVTTSEAAVEFLGRSGILSDVLQILKRFSTNRQICLTCTGALASLAVNEFVRRNLASEDTVKVLCDTLRMHLEDGEVTESICCALWILSLQGTCSEYISHVDCFADHYEEVTMLLLQAIKKHMERPVLVANACLALASLLRTSELAAFAFLLPHPDYSGLSLIKECFELHSDDPEVVEYIALLLTELLKHGDVLQEWHSEEVAGMLNKIKIRFGSSKEIVSQAETVLQKLQQYAADLATSKMPPPLSSTAEKSDAAMKMLHPHSPTEESHLYRSASLQLPPTQDAPTLPNYSYSAPVASLYSDSATRMLHPHSATKESRPYRSASLQLAPTQDAPSMLPRSHSDPVHMLRSPSALMGLLPSHKAATGLPHLQHALKEHQYSSIDSSNRLSQSVATKMLHPHGGTKGSPPFHTDSLHRFPEEEASAKLPKSYGATDGLLASHSADMDQLLPHRVTMDQLPSQGAAMGIPPSQQAFVEHPPSGSAKRDVAAFQSVTTGSHPLSPSRSATMDLHPYQSSKKGPLPSHIATEGLLPSDSASKGLPSSQSATVGLPSSERTDKGLLPTDSAIKSQLISDRTNEGQLPSQGAMGLLPTDSASKGLRISDITKGGELPSHGAMDLLSSDSASKGLRISDKTDGAQLPSHGAMDLLPSDSASKGPRISDRTNGGQLPSHGDMGLLPTDSASKGPRISDRTNGGQLPSQGAMGLLPSDSDGKGPRISDRTNGGQLPSQGAMGLLPSDSDGKGPGASGGANLDLLPSQSATMSAIKSGLPSHSTMGPLPSQSATMGPLASERVNKRLVPSDGAAVGLSPSDSAAVGLVPSRDAKEGLPPTHSAAMDTTAARHVSVKHTPSSSANKDLLASQSATAVLHPLSPSDSATMGLLPDQSAKRGPVHLRTTTGRPPLSDSDDKGSRPLHSTSKGPPPTHGATVSSLASQRANMGERGTRIAAGFLPSSGHAATVHLPFTSTKRGLLAQRAAALGLFSKSTAARMVPPECDPPREAP